MLELDKIHCGDTTPIAKAVGLDAAGGQSHTSDGLCTGASSEKEQ